MVLKFIKRLFRTQPEEIELRENELAFWISEKAKEAKTEMELFLKASNQEFEAFVEESKERIKELRDAKLQNPNISNKEIDFMEGNRIAYMKKLVLLIKDINFPKKVEEVPIFPEIMQEKFDDFLKSSIRTYQIISQFFGNEIEKINSSLKKFSDIDQRLMTKYNDLKIPNFNIILNEFSNKASSMEKSRLFSKELDKKEEDFEELKKQIEDAKKDMETIKSSKEHKEFDDLDKEKIEIEKEVKEHLYQFQSIFSSITYALKKYSKITMKHTEWIDAYLEDSIDTIRSDNDLIIIEILANLKENSETLKINEKKFTKIKKNIKKLDKKFLESFRDKLKDLETKQQEIFSKIKKSDVLGNVHKAETEFDHLCEKQKLIEKHIDELKLKISKIDTKPVKEEEIERINEMLDVKIKIVV